MNIRQIIMAGLLIACGLYAIAKEGAGDSQVSRKLASVDKKNGVICGQGQNITNAEQKLNDKLGIGQGEALTLMTGKFGKISNPKVTGVTINVVPGAKGEPSDYILCAAVTGD